MSTIDYPLEALPLNFLSFGFLTSVNCVWTWVVVLTTTAAVSALAIRASSVSPRGKSPDEPSEWYQSPAPDTILQRFSNPSPVPVRVSVPIHTSTESSTPTALDTIGRTRGKFSLYYNQKDEEDDMKINGCDCDSEGDDDDGVVLRWVGATLKIKMEGIGLYECQDLTVLDGSVVRLWDGCRRRKPVSPSVTCGGEAVVIW